MRVFCWTVVSALALLVAVSEAPGQTSNAILQGTVTDPGGAVIPGASVKVRSVDTALERTATTNDAGL